MSQSPDSKDKTVLTEPFNTGSGYSGQEYDIEREREEGRKLPSGTVDSKAKGAVAKGPRGRIAPDKGQRASFDPHTGQVHGSGATDGIGDGRQDFTKDS